MTRRLVFPVLGLCVAAWACSNGQALREARYACTSSGDCADGYECLAGECQVPGQGGGGGGDDSGVGGGTGGGGTGGGATGDGGTGGGGSGDGGTDAGSGGGTGGGTGGGGGASGLDAGVSCTSSTQCASGLTCVDGVCCRTACSAACDSCNQAGNLGTCLPRPGGSVSTSCGGYACNGTSTSCPTACAADAGFSTCATGYTCLPPSCSACWTSFTDNFSTGLTQWTLTNSGGTASVDALGRLEISARARQNQAADVSAVVTTAFALPGCGVSAELTSPPTLFGSNYSGAMRLAASNAQALPSFAFVFDSRGLVAEWRFADGGVGAQVLQAATSTMPRWLRLDESGGSIRWRTTSGTTFTTVHSVTHGGGLDSMRLGFSGTFPSQPGNDQSTYTVDNINLGP